MEKEKLAEIATKSNSIGWQWSHADVETYFTWEVVSWKLIPQDKNK